MTISSVKTGAIGDSLLAGNAAYNPSSYESIATLNGSGSSNTVTFSSIPSTYKSLQIRVAAISTNTTPVSGQNIFATFNGDSSANYTRHSLEGDGAGNVSASGSTASTSMILRSLAVSSGTNIAGTSIIDLENYSSITQNKTLRALAGANVNSSSAFISFVGLFSGLWINTAAITSISLRSGSGNFATSSVFSLYGIKG